MIKVSYYDQDGEYIGVGGLSDPKVGDEIYTNGKNYIITGVLTRGNNGEITVKEANNANS